MTTRAAVPERHNSRRTGLIFLAAGCIAIVLSFLIGISDNPPVVALMLGGFFAVVLGVVYGVTGSGRRTPAQQLLYWSPRALCMAFALFLSLFALDVFSEGRGVQETAVALVLHLIPTLLVLALLAVSWRREWIGGVILPLLGVAYVVDTWNKPFGVWSTHLLMAGPLVLTGVLFLLNWYYRKTRRG
jgi:hypothetical protein